MTSSTTMRMALSALLVMLCSSPALAALGFSDNNQECRDRNTHCRSLGRDGYCNHAHFFYRQWMTDNCAKTCKACSNAVVEVKDPVDGSWGSWSAYGACLVTCGAGIKSRIRVCDSPVPQNGGKSCVGNAESTTNCTAQQCPDGSKESKCSTSGDCDEGLVCSNYNLCAEPKFANQINGTCATTYDCAKMHGGRVICYKEEGNDKLCKCDPAFHQSYEYGANFHACLNSCHRPRTVTPFFTSVYNGYVSSDLDVGSKLDWVKSRKECDKQCMEDDNCIATHIYWKEAGSDPMCSHIMRGNYPAPRGFDPKDSDYTVNALEDLDVKPVYNAIFSMKGCNITKSD